MLELFPAAVLDNSILTSVLVGLWITWFFQETLGWNFTGLVVPGYLASILSIDPTTGAVVTVEAALTYALVYAVSEVAPVHWPTSRLFGRDRFFALLLGSVTVRLAVEGYGLAALESTLGYRLSPSLHSMGLLVMPLAANALWRTGMARGVFRLGIPVLLTWGCVELILVPYTNLSLASFELAYEDLALDFVTSPRAYFLLLVGAWLGSVFNRAYGFDYGGIIVPGLLTVCWMFPTRIATTLAEGLVVAVLLRGVLLLPGLRRANLGGGRLLVVAFTTVYAVKFALGWVSIGTWPGMRISDLFGFGYLLPTLIALRVHKHGQPFRSLVPALGTSILAFALATGVGWALFRWLPPPAPEVGPRHDADLILLAYSDSGPVPRRKDLRQSTSGGNGFGALERRAGVGPAVVARLGTPGTGFSALEIAAAIDARAILLCAPLGDACTLGTRTLRAEGPTWIVEPTSGTSELRLAGTDGLGVDLTALGAVVPDLEVGRASPEATRLLVGPEVRFGGKIPETTTPPKRIAALEDAPSPSLGALRLLRYEAAPALDRFLAGDERATALLARIATALGGAVHRDGDRLGLVLRDTWVGVRPGGSDRVVHVPAAEAPGMMPFALATAEAIDARFVVADTAPSLVAERYPRDRPALALLIGLLASDPNLEILELQPLRDVYDVRAELAWSTALATPEQPAIVDAVDTWLGQPGVAAWTGELDRLVLQRPDTPLRHRAVGEHTVLFVSTRMRHRFVPFHDPIGIERHFSIGPASRTAGDWADTWREPTRTADSEADWARLSIRAAREGVALEAACHERGTCPWITATRCLDGPCERAWLPRFEGPR